MLKVDQPWLNFRMYWVNSVPLKLIIYRSLRQRYRQFSAYFMDISFIRDTINNGTNPDSPGCRLVGHPLNACKSRRRAHITAAFGRLPSRYLWWNGCFCFLYPRIFSQVIEPAILYKTPTGKHNWTNTDSIHSMSQKMSHVLLCHDMLLSQYTLLVTFTSIGARFVQNKLIGNAASI